MTLRIGLIGAGEMGAGIGLRLRQHGADVVTSIAGRSEASIARAARAGLLSALTDAEVVDGSTLILSIVPPSEALAVAVSISGALAAAPVKPTYVDCNAVAPETVLKIATVVRASSCRFIDAAITGGPPWETQYQGTRLYAAGPNALELTVLRDYGLDIQVMTGEIGAASAFKMCHGGITKGLTGIGAAMLVNAARFGVLDTLHSELKDRRPTLFEWLARQVPQMYPKAHRWVGEMEEIAAFSHDDAATEATYLGLARIYEAFARAYEADDALGENLIKMLSEFR